MMGKDGHGASLFPIFNGKDVCVGNGGHNG